MGPRGGLDILKKRKSLGPVGKRTIRQLSSPWPGYSNDYAMVAIGDHAASSYACIRKIITVLCVF